MPDIKAENVKTFHEKVEKIFEISWENFKFFNFILFFLQGKNYAKHN